MIRLSESKFCSEHLIAHSFFLRKRLFLYSVILFVFSSCSESFKKVRSDTELELNFTEVCIPIKYSQNSLYIQAISKFTDSATLFYGYNKYNHKFDVFNLSKRSFLKEIQLEFDGPNGIPYFSSFDVRDNGDIILGDFKSFSKLKHDKVEMLRFSSEKSDLFTFKNGFDFDNYLLDPGGKDKIPVDSIGNFYLGVFPISKMRYYEIIKFNFENKTIEKLDYQFPEIFEDKFYGDNMTPNVTLLNNSLYINYGFSSNVFRYDLEKKTLEQYNLKSAFTENMSGSITQEDFRDPALRAAHDKEITFFGLKHDPHRNFFYRVHLASRETLKDKPVFYFMVFDMELNTLKEIKLPKGLKPYFEIGKEGVFFPKQTESESKLCFELLLLETSSITNKN